MRSARGSGSRPGRCARDRVRWQSDFFATGRETQPGCCARGCAGGCAGRVQQRTTRLWLGKNACWSVGGRKGGWGRPASARRRARRLQAGGVSSRGGASGRVLYNAPRSRLRPFSLTPPRTRPSPCRTRITTAAAPSSNTTPLRVRVRHALSEASVLIDIMAWQVPLPDRAVTTLSSHSRPMAAATSSSPTGSLGTVDNPATSPNRPRKRFMCTSPISRCCGWG